MVFRAVFRQLIFSLPLFPPTVALPSEQVRASALLQRPVAAAVAFDSRRWWKSLGDPDKKFFYNRNKVIKCFMELRSLRKRSEELICHDSKLTQLCLLRLLSLVNPTTMVYLSKFAAPCVKIPSINKSRTVYSLYLDWNPILHPQEMAT